MNWFLRLSELQRGLVVYGTILLAWLLGFELPSKDVLGWAPWPSTTRTIRDAIKWWHPVALMVVFFLLVLSLHLDNGWKVRYLIATVAAIVVAVVVHVVAP
jgi:hypothetical protein